MAVIASLLCAGTMLADNGRLVRSGDRVPGEYIVTFEGDTVGSLAVAEDVAGEAGVTPEHVYQHAVKGFSFRASEAQAMAISRHPNVSAVYEATKMYTGASGVQWAPPWGLDRIDASTGLDQSFTYGFSGQGVVAYVIDSGINPTADIPAARIREHRNFVPTENRTDDCAGHGTRVAHVLGGATYGVAKDVTFVSYRVLDCMNAFASDAWVMAGVDAMVADHNARPNQLAVANLSLFTWSSISTAIDAAVQRAVNAGITVVTIAGNVTGGSPSQNACTISPGHLGASGTPNGIITVASSTAADAMAVHSKGGSCVDLFAPGQNVDIGPGMVGSGTSFAAPHVAGVVAMHLERKAGFAIQYRTPVENEADVLAVASRDRLTGLTAGSPNVLVYSRWIRRRACCTFPSQ